MEKYKGGINLSAIHIARSPMDISERKKVDAEKQRIKNRPQWSTKHDTKKPQNVQILLDNDQTFVAYTLHGHHGECMNINLHL